MAKVKHIHKEYPEHDWIKDENGEIDEWAVDSEYHNGPMCKRCYHSFCIYCDPDGYKDNPCIVDKYVCPKCENENILTFGFNYNYCPVCGESLDWSEVNERN